MGNEEALREEIERQSREIDWLRSSLSMIAGVEIWPKDSVVNRHNLMTVKQSAAAALEERSWFKRSSQVTLKIRTNAEVVRDNADALFKIAETLRQIAQEAAFAAPGRQPSA